MKFGSGKIGMVTIQGKAYDLTEEPTAIGCNAGFVHARAIDEFSNGYTVFFKEERFRGLIPWNAERIEK